MNSIHQKLRNGIVLFVVLLLYMLWVALILIVAWTFGGILICFGIQHLELITLLGICSVAFFYRVLFYKSPEQRKADKEGKARIEAERRQWEHHKFYPVSKRARAAYLILCLEETVIHYGQDIQQWDWVLKRLWEVTTASCEDDWVDICDLFSEEVLTYATYEELKEHRKIFPYAYSKEEFAFLRSLYTRAGSALEVIEPLMDNIYYVIVEDWGEGERPNTPSALQYIDKTEQLLRGKDIPLPHDEQVFSFLLSQKNRHFGKPFDGFQLSVLSKSSAFCKKKS